MCMMVTPRHLHWLTKSVVRLYLRPSQVHRTNFTSGSRLIVQIKPEDLQQLTEVRCIYPLKHYIFDDPSLIVIRTFYIINCGVYDDLMAGILSGLKRSVFTWPLDVALKEFNIDPGFEGNTHIISLIFSFKNTSYLRRCHSWKKIRTPASFNKPPTNCISEGSSIKFKRYQALNM